MQVLLRVALCAACTAALTATCDDFVDRVPPAFRDAVASLAGVAKVGVIDCHAPLPSGKSIVQRFHIDGKASPAMFFVGNADPPRQLPVALAKNETALVERVTVLANPSVLAAKSPSAFERGCLRRRACLAVLHAGPLTAGRRTAVLSLPGRFRT